MAAMTTVLTEFADNGNSRTYSLSGHGALKPRIVIQKRKVATTSTSSAEDTVDVIYGTEDSAGNILPGRTSFGAVVRRPVNGDDADATAALAVFRDIVNSDEFAAMVVSQNFLK
jgi:hypothetical protein